MPSILVAVSTLEVAFSNGAARRLGLVPQPKGRPVIFLELIAPEDRQALLDGLAETATSTAATWQGTLRLLVPGKPLTTLVYTQLHSQGGDRYYGITLVDITGRQQVQTELTATASRYKSFIDHNTEGVFCQEFKTPVAITETLETLVEAIVADTFLTDCNDVMAHMYGYQQGADMTGLPTSRLIDPTEVANREYIRAFIRQDFKTIGAESHEKDRFGEEKYFINNAIGIVEDGYLLRIWGTQRDITEIKKIEKKLALFADLVEQTSDVLTAADLEFKPLTWNGAAEKVYGLSAAQVIGNNIRQYIDFHYEGTTREAIRECVATTGVWRGEMSFVRPTDGQLVTLLTAFKRLNHEDGEPLGYIISSTDITERKAADSRIRLLAGLVEGTSDVLIALDQQFRAISWNEAARYTTGITAAEALGHSIHRLLAIQHTDTDFASLRKLLQEDGEWQGEIRFTRPADKKVCYLLATYKPFRNEEGQKSGYLIACRDITGQREAEQRIAATELRFQQMADAAPVMIWMVNEANQPVYANQPFLEYTGLTEASYLETPWVSLIHPEDAATSLHKFNDYFRKQLPVTLIYRLRNKDGQYRWVQDSGTPHYLNADTFLGYIGSIIDIHTTKQREEQFHYGATVLENVMDSVVTTDLQGVVKSWNKVAGQFFGYTETQVMGRSYHELVPLTFLTATDTAVQQQLQTQGFWKGEVSYTAKGDQPAFFFYTITYLYSTAGYRTGIMLVAHDITEQKRVEESLQKSERFYRSLTADSLESMILTDAEGIITFVSPSVKNSLGFTNEEIAGRNAFEFVHPEDRELAQKSFQREVALDAEVHFIVVRLLKKSGDWLWCMVRGHNMLDHPHINSLIIYFHDDTLRKEANDALKQSEKRFRHLIHDLQIGVILQDPSGSVLMVNRIILDTLQVKEETLLGSGIPDVIANAVKENGQPFRPEERPLHRALTTGQAVTGTVMGIDHPLTGQRIWMMLNVNPIYNEAGDIIHLITSFIDITERKALETRLLQEERNQQRKLTQATIDGQEKERREIGKELHDNIGQQLTTTKLYLDLAKSTADATTAEMIALSLRSISDVINEIRTISRSLVPPTLGDLGLIESLQDLVESIERLQAFEIDFTYQLKEDALPENMKLMLFRIVQEQLNNIVRHAAAREVKIGLKETALRIDLEISDNGKGFDPLAIRKGLGLTNIRNRAELFGGEVTITTAPGTGCTLQVSIPKRGPGYTPVF